jgi:hypothetical protein
MYTDDEDFEEIYQSLTPGLVIVACSAKSLISMLRSFCYSLKGAAIRCGSDAVIFTGSPIDWEVVGTQMIEEHRTRGIRVFLINRFEDFSPANVTVRLGHFRGFDTLDGSIDADYAKLVQQSALAWNVTILVTTIAGKESQIQDRKIARWEGKEQGVFIGLVHNRLSDDWYSATVTTGATEKSYDVDFVSQCPQPPKPQPQPESVADTSKAMADVPAMPRPSWLRRLLGR